MKVLVINAHPDPHSSTSATNQMQRHLLAKLPAGSAEVLNLAQADIQAVDKAVLDMFIQTVFRQQAPDPEQTRLMARMGALVAQLKSASHLVIALPMYNFGIPARLKDWIDNIVIPGQTFRYDENGIPQGLMGTHKALILQASGGVYSSGSHAGMEFTIPYLQALFGGFLGFKSVDAIRAEGTSQASAAAAAVQKACVEIDTKLDAFMAE